MPILLQSLIKHKEGKTFKFIVRNIFYISTLTIQPLSQPSDLFPDKSFPSFRVSFDESKLVKNKVQVITDFLNVVMIEKTCNTFAEKKLKQEARLLFVKEVVRNLCESTNSPKQQSQWPLLRTIFNLGAIWLIAEIMLEEKDSP